MCPMVITLSRSRNATSTIKKMDRAFEECSPDLLPSGTRAITAGLPSSFCIGPEYSTATRHHSCGADLPLAKSKGPCPRSFGCAIGWRKCFQRYDKAPGMINGFIAAQGLRKSLVARSLLSPRFHSQRRRHERSPFVLPLSIVIQRKRSPALVQASNERPALKFVHLLAIVGPVEP